MRYPYRLKRTDVPFSQLFNYSAVHMAAGVRIYQQKLADWIYALLTDTTKIGPRELFRSRRVASCIGYYYWNRFESFSGMPSGISPRQ